MSLNIVMKEKDIIGCGYKRAEDHSDKGLAYFTCNGERLAENLDGVQSGLWPVIHIQKKVKMLTFCYNALVKLIIHVNYDREILAVMLQLKRLQ